MRKKNKKRQIKTKSIKEMLYKSLIVTFIGFIIFLLIVVHFFPIFLVNSSWYDGNWEYRRPITIDNTGNATELATYQSKVDIIYDADMQADFDDIRFTDSDGLTLLDHFRESYTDSTSAVFWVEVPAISASSEKTIYMYYGNGAAVTASNGDNTFNFFDDFSNANTVNSSALWHDKTATDNAAHPIIKDEKVYVAAQSGNLLIYNLNTGALIHNYEGFGQYVAAPAIDADGFIHVYSFGNSTLYKVNEATGVTEDTYAVSAIDIESMAYDEANNALIVPTATALLSINCADYSVRWTYAMESGVSMAGAAPLIVGDYVYYRRNNIDELQKISNADGTYVHHLTGLGGYFNTYHSPIYDADHDLIYTYGAVNQVAAISPGGTGNMSVSWTKTLGEGMTTPRLAYTASYYNGKLFQPVRDVDDNYKSKLYALDVLNSGAILWTNTNAYDDNMDMTNTIVNDDYIIAGTLRYGYLTYGRIFIIRQSDGFLLTSTYLHYSQACFRPTTANGIVVMGSNMGNVEAFDLGSGDNSDLLYWGGNSYHNGYVGSNLTIDPSFTFASTPDWIMPIGGTSAVAGGALTLTHSTGDNLGYLKTSSFTTTNAITEYKVTAATEGTDVYDLELIIIRHSDTGSVALDTDLTTNPDSSKIAQYYAPIGFETDFLNSDLTNHIIGLAANGTDVSYTVDRVSVGSAALDESSNVSGGIGLGTWRAGSSISIDYALVRDYTTPEPTSAVGAEESPPSATFDNDFIARNVGDISVNYNLIDKESDTLNISQSATSGIEYSTDNLIWVDATDAGGLSEGLINLNSGQNPGENHIFIWDSEADLPNTEDTTVYLRIRPNDGGVDANVWVTSNPFNLDNVPPSITFDNDSTAVNNADININYNIIDNGGNTINISQTATSGIEYSLDGSVWADATDAGGLSEGLINLSSSASPGDNHVFIWDADMDLDAIEDETVYIRIKPNDSVLDAPGWTQSSAYKFDDKAPTNMGSLSAANLDYTSLTLVWNAVTETFFDEYEISYGTDQNAVLNRTAASLDESDSALLGLRITNNIPITNIASGAAYYFKLWAKDEGGHEVSSEIFNVTTPALEPVGGVPSEGEGESPPAEPEPETPDEPVIPPPEPEPEPVAPPPEPEPEPEPVIPDVPVTPPPEPQIETPDVPVPPPSNPEPEPVIPPAVPETPTPAPAQTSEPEPETPAPQPEETTSPEEPSSEQPAQTGSQPEAAASPISISTIEPLYNEQDIPSITGIETSVSDVENDQNSNNISDNWEESYGALVVNSYIDTDSDGISDYFEGLIGTNPVSKDSDQDGLSDTEEYFDYKTDPNSADKEFKPSLQITNFSSSTRDEVIGTTEVGKPAEIFFQGTGTAGKYVLIMSKPKDGGAPIYNLTKVSDNGKFALTSLQGFTTGNYVVTAKEIDCDAKTVQEALTCRTLLETDPFEIKVNVDIQIDPPKVIRFDNIDIKPTIDPKDLKIEINNNQPKIIGKTNYGSKIIATWESVILTSILLTDTVVGEFEILPPNPLPQGQHKVTLYAKRIEDNVVSQPITLEFSINSINPQPNKLLANISSFTQNDVTKGFVDVGGFGTIISLIFYAAKKWFKKV